MYLKCLSFVLFVGYVAGNSRSFSSVFTSTGNSGVPQTLNLQQNRLSEPQSECIPDKSSLNVTLARGGVLNRCTISPTNSSQLFSRKEFKREPKSVQYRYADKEKKYTLIVYATSARLATNYLEWIVSNIKGSDLRKGRVEGEVRVRYKRAGLVYNEQQIHEYVIFAETVDDQRVHIPRSRYNWNVLYFLDQQPKQLYGPVGVVNGRTRPIK